MELEGLLPEFEETPEFWHFFNSTNISDGVDLTVEEYYRNNIFDEATYLALLLVYIFQAIFGMLVNSLVISVVILQRSLRTPRNLFFVNLAISDILTFMFTGPAYLLRMRVLYFWPLGSSKFVCKFLHAVEIVPYIAATFFVCGVVAVNSRNVRKGAVLTAILFIWLFAVFISTPMYTWADLHLDYGKIYVGTGLESVSFCFVEPPSEETGEVYSFLLVILHYVFPCGIICGVICTSQRRKDLTLRNARKSHNVLLILTSCLFWLCWLPIHVAFVAFRVFELGEGENQISHSVVRLTLSVTQWIGMLPGCVIPILVYCLDNSFQREIKNMIRKVGGCCGKGNMGIWTTTSDQHADDVGYNTLSMVDTEQDTLI